MVTKKSIKDKIDFFIESVFWSAYIAYVPLVVLLFIIMLVNDFFS